MQYTLPHYYHKFQCVAEVCTDTCCAGWAIMIDSQSLKHYKRQKGGFGNRLANSIDWKEGSFKQYEGRCAFLNEQNLCDIYTEAGPQSLCKTCKSYPRHTEEYEGLREISLSLSCPEAAGLILGCEEPVRFLTRKKPGGESFPDFDFFLFEKLMESRDFLFTVLQNRGLRLPLRLAMALGFAHDLQGRINRGKLYETEALIRRYGNENSPEKIEKKLGKFRADGKELYSQMKTWFSLFDRLEVLNKGWPQYSGNRRAVLFDKGAKGYETLQRDFKVWLDEKEERRRLWEQWGEQLAVYFLFTYFCGAVYDGQAFEKAKLAVAGTLFIQDMAKALWKEKNGVLGQCDIVDLAHRYGREVEHSDLNLSVVYEKLNKTREFNLEHFLKAILFAGP